MAGVGALYEGWERINSRVHDRLSRISEEELRLVGADDWPVWALIAHMAGARVYWLCGVFKEPGAETTPFPDPFGDGWEDHLDVPRGAADLAFAIDSSWRIVESCLAGWTPDSLSQTFERERQGRLQQHTRASVLARLTTHDAFHCGEVSLILGMHGRQSLDPWAASAELG